MEYQKYGYCKEVECSRLKDLYAGKKDFCQEWCEAYRFHKYLQGQGYKIIKGSSVKQLLEAVEALKPISPTLTCAACGKETNSLNPFCSECEL